MRIKIKNTVFNIKSIDSKHGQVNKLVKDKIKYLSKIDAIPRAITLDCVDDFINFNKSNLK